MRSPVTGPALSDSGSPLRQSRSQQPIRSVLGRRMSRPTEASPDIARIPPPRGRFRPLATSSARSFLAVAHSDACGGSLVRPRQRTNLPRWFDTLSLDDRRELAVNEAGELCCTRHRPNPCKIRARRIRGPYPRRLPRRSPRCPPLTAHPIRRRCSTHRRAGPRRPRA